MPKAMVNLLTKMFASARGDTFLLGFESVVPCEIVAVNGDRVIVELRLEDIAAVGIPKDHDT